MKILAVDDEALVLKDLEESLLEAQPDCELISFTLPGKALEYAGNNAVDVAFIDIELGSMNGLILAKEIKDIQPKVHIILVTSYEHYALRAFQIHAAGYLLKPVTAEDIRRELEFIYGDISQSCKKKIRIQTFGGFAVFVDEKPLRFTRAKSKELLAYLVNKRGAAITTPQACAILWEEQPYDRKRKNYFQSIVLDLRRTLKAAGIEGLLVRSRNSLAVDTSQFECDSYLFIEGNTRAVNSYRHDYLSDYSWAEFMIGNLEEYRDK
ncbi:MAG: response regulator [Eubacteriales bacterium]|nr:response regulator [Eubacteriales bacterium]